MASLDTSKNVRICSDDLPLSAIESAANTGLIAWDIETSGLSWTNDKIGTCQIYLPPSQVYIVQLGQELPHRLISLLNEPNVCKVFHHAMFDLCFMAYHWSVSAQNVVCTKIASKLLHPQQKNHGLRTLVEAYCGVSLDKSVQTSNWLSNSLTDEQITYAAKDVIYLPTLYTMLQEELISCKRWHLADACFKFLPIRVQLDILGTADIFQY